jgi:hypothetical protein
VALTPALALLTSTVDACIHQPKDFQYPVKAGAERAIIYFDGARQDIIVRPGYVVDAPKGKIRNDRVEGLNTLAFLMPLPALPDSYREVDDKLFKELSEFTKAESEPQRSRKSPDEGVVLGADEAEKGGVEFLEAVRAGDYTIQPIKAAGEQGAQELNVWLEQNGFGRVDLELMRHYVDKRWCWLAIKCVTENGLPASGALKPLHMSFATTTAVYPLKIRAGSGVFDLELWVLAPSKLGKLDLEATKALRLLATEQANPEMIQKNRELKDINKLPKTLREALADKDGARVKAGAHTLVRLFGSQMNLNGELGKLADEVTFTFKPVGKK